MGEIMLLAFIGTGLLVGMVLGLTGAGGSILAVPALMTLTHWPLSQVAPAALLAVAAAAITGSVEGLRRGIVRYRAAALMALAGLPAAPLGLQAAVWMPESILLGLFSLILFWVGLRTLRDTFHKPEPVVGDRPSRLPPCRLDHRTGRFGWPLRCLAAMSALGAVTGGLSGLLGVGGGFVIVPGLRRISDLPVHSTVATSLLVVALTAAETIAVAAVSDRLPPLAPVLPFVAANVIGMLTARRLAARLSASVISRAFALITWVVCGDLLWKAWLLLGLGA